MSSAADGVGVRWETRGLTPTDAPPDIDLSRAPEVRPLGVQRWVGGGATVTTACYERALPLGWPGDDMGDDVDAVVLDRLAGVATRFAGEPLRVTARDPRAWTLAADHGAARALLGFDGGKVVGCVLACQDGAAGAGACASLATSATLDGATGTAPPPGIVLALASGAIHHPGATLVASLALIATVCAGLVRFRKRPG